MDPDGEGSKDPVPSPMHTCAPRDTGDGLGNGGKYVRFNVVADGINIYVAPTKILGEGCATQAFIRSSVHSSNFFLTTMLHRVGVFVVYQKRRRMEAYSKNSIILWQYWVFLRTVFFSLTKRHGREG